MRCDTCGTELRSSARFCDTCGVPAASGAPRTRRNPREYTPRHLAEKILTQRSAIQGERKQVTVLFVDVKGSMDLLESVEPESWHGVMNRFFELLAEVIHGFEGTINQFTGDGVMALFGAPIGHEDHAQRACFAALRLREQLRSYSEELKRTQGLNFSVRMGLNSGTVVVGRIGDDLRMDYTAIGSVVGLASRMEQLAEPGTIYLTGTTAALVAGYCRLSDLGEFQIKGVREPTSVSQLEGQGPLRTRFDASLARGLTRFVGRVRERRRLEAALANLERGQGSVIGVAGEAGVGKSRLCFEFTESCRSRGIRVRRARAVAHGRMIPFLPVFELLRSILGVAEQDRDVDARRKIASTVLLLERELTDRLPLLFEFLGVGTGKAEDPKLDPDARRRQLIEVVMRLVRARGRREPAVFLFEDLHWLDRGSEAFLAVLAAIAEETRTLVLVNFRPGYRAEWMQQPCYTALALAPLGDRAVGQLLDEQLGRDASTAGLRRAIRARAAGIPFFVEEVVYSLLEAGVLERVGDACVKVKPIKHLEVPDTVTAIVAARIDRLSETEKRVLQTAAVIGRSFSSKLLGRVLELPEQQIFGVLHSLASLGFVYPESEQQLGEYRFKHPLTEEVAYDAQLARSRASLHAAVAREIEGLQPDAPSSNAALLAHHEEGAGRLLVAARWHARAAEWVGQRDVDAAHRHWDAAMSLAERTPESAERDELLLQAHFKLLELAWRLGFSREETYRIFLRGVGVAERRGERMSLAMLALGYAIYRGVIGDEDGEHRYASEAAALADEIGNVFVALTARVVMATALRFDGRLREAIEVADGVVEDRQETGDGDLVGLSPYTYILGLRGALHALCGRFDRASLDLERALARATEAGDSESLACVHGFASEHARCTGESLDAVAHARRMLDAAGRTGIPLLLVESYLSLGCALVLTTQWDDAVEALEQGLEIANSRGVMLGPKRRVLVALAEAYLGRGEEERARHLTEQLLAPPASGTLLVEIRARLVLARALLRLEGGKARDAIRTAIAHARLRVEQSGAQSLLPEIHRVLSEVAECDGDHGTRMRELREAHRLYGEMAALGHANRIARIIAQAGDSA